MSCARANNHILKQADFSLDQLFGIKLPSNRSLEITDLDIEEILEYSKGPYTFMVLSLLYPNLKFDQIKFHQDHIHPASLFTNEQQEKIAIAKEKWSDWEQMKDKLPNLQLMEGKENESKNNTSFKTWLNGKDANENPSVPDVTRFMKDNYIPDNVNLDLIDFAAFYKSRKNLLRVEIKKVLAKKL